MPTYKNETAKPIIHPDMGYMRVEPGQTAKLPFYVPHEKLGLTLVAEEEPDDTKSAVYLDVIIELNPHPDGKVHHEIVTPTPVEADEEVIPATQRIDLHYYEAFELSVYAMHGTATMQIANGELPLVSILPHESHVSQYAYTECPYVTFSTVTGCTLRFKQEAKNYHNSLRRGL